MANRDWINADSETVMTAAEWIMGSRMMTLEIMVPRPLTIAEEDQSHMFIRQMALTWGLDHHKTAADWKNQWRRWFNV